MENNRAAVLQQAGEQLQEARDLQHNVVLQQAGELQEVRDRPLLLAGVPIIAGALPVEGQLLEDEEGQVVDIEVIDRGQDFNIANIDDDARTSHSEISTGLGSTSSVCGTSETQEGSPAVLPSLSSDDKDDGTYPVSSSDDYSRNNTLSDVSDLVSDSASGTNISDICNRASNINLPSCSGAPPDLRNYDDVGLATVHGTHEGINEGIEAVHRKRDGDADNIPTTSTKAMGDDNTKQLSRKSDDECSISDSASESVTIDISYTASNINLPRRCANPDLRNYDDVGLATVYGTYEGINEGIEGIRRRRDEDADNIPTTSTKAMADDNTKQLSRKSDDECSISDSASETVTSDISYTASNINLPRRSAPPADNKIISLSRKRKGSEKTDELETGSKVASQDETATSDST